MADENLPRRWRGDLRTHRALSEASRVRIVEELGRNPAPMDVNQLAGRLGLHHNTIRAHLEVLERAGLVVGRPERRALPGRLRTAYRLTATAPVGDHTSGYRLLAEVLASYLTGSLADPGAAAAEAGRAWGRFLVERLSPFERPGHAQALDRVRRLLADLGFEPEVEGEDGDTTRVLLHRCPFHDLARRRPEIACGVHQGLMQGALQELGAGVEVEGLEPFAVPSLCVVRLRRAAPAGRP
jgi:predicted ArsR family transcriptional regulator